MNVQKTAIEGVTGWSVGEKDATAFNVYHDPENNKNGVLAFGHSKDHRPDLLQFKQGLATSDPGGVPILSKTQECIYSIMISLDLGGDIDVLGKSREL